MSNRDSEWFKSSLSAACYHCWRYQVHKVHWDFILKRWDTPADKWPFVVISVSITRTGYWTPRLFDLKLSISLWPAISTTWLTSLRAFLAAVEIIRTCSLPHSFIHSDFILWYQIPVSSRIIGPLFPVGLHSNQNTFWHCDSADWDGLHES